ncbi:hypothetical protein GCM10008967_04630 [Bacillus carboniphilus]|uniref:DUF4878 domain-containing protein n=1 Tax=Bacillus carboniphilus TaxID=86663 RepID=A0ABP3FK97_9BACI
MEKKRKTVVIEENIYLSADGNPQATVETTADQPKKRSPLPIILLILLIGMWMAVLAFDSDSPEEAVQALFAHVNAGEYEQARLYFSEELGWDVPNIDFPPELKILQINEKVNGDTAEVFVKFEESFEGGSSPMIQEVTFLLKKDSEVDWVIYNIIEP